MAESATTSRDSLELLPDAAQRYGAGYVEGWRAGALLLTFFLVSALSQVDRILPHIMAESIKAELSLNDTQIGLLTGVAFAVCYTLLSLPLARAADRGSPRFVLVSCIFLWSAMTALGGLASSFLLLALTRFGVAFGEAGAMPAAHAIIARRIRPERRGLAIGLFAMGIPLGTMVGFAAGGALGDALGWRMVLIGAGIIGLAIGAMALAVPGPTPPRKTKAMSKEPFLRTSFALLSSPGFRWLFAGAVVASFAAAPFYVFVAPFLIRTHGFTASEAGLAFGLLQGLMGIAGTLLAALFAPVGWVSILLLVPSMFSFAFMLPWGFGAAHLVAGEGREAMATSLVMIGSGLLGPAIGPLLVGVVSDAATAAGLANGLGIGLLLIPVASLLTGLALLTANRRVAARLRGAVTGHASHF